jgi:hypothetical protein
MTALETRRFEHAPGTSALPPIATEMVSRLTRREGPQAEVGLLSFDDLIGGREELIRNGEAERLGGF